MEEPEGGRLQLEGEEVRWNGELGDIEEKLKLKVYHIWPRSNGSLIAQTTSPRILCSMHYYQSAKE